MELRDYPDRDPISPPVDWEPTSPSIARKPIGSVKQPSPYTSPDFSSSFAQRAAFQRQTTSDTAYYGASTPLGIWEPSHPHAPGSGRPQNYRENSQASLLTRDASNDSPPNLPRGPPEPPGPGYLGIPGPPPPTSPPKGQFLHWWINEWKPSWSMYVLVFSGIAFAVGHHFYYRNLHGEVAVDQQGKFRYGALLAFLSKACFLNAVVLAFRQRVLMMIRRKMLTLSTLDSLFAASEDLTALLNWEAWVNAKFAMALTIFIWTSPLIVIFTSYTLTVQPQRKEEITECQNIRTLNFSHESQVYWRTPAKVDNWFESSVSLWNTTVLPGQENIDEDDPDDFDYYTASSQQFNTIALKTAYVQQAVMRPKAPQEICGKGWNCSYVVEFVGPGYKCQGLASGVNAEVKKLGDAECPFNTTVLAPLGNLTYYAMLDRGDYENPQMIADAGGRPKAKRPYPKNFATFRTEPILWFGYAEVEDRSKPQPAKPLEGDWFKAYTPTIFGCEHYQTKYKIQFNYTGQVQTHHVKSRKFLEKVIDTTFLPGVKDPDKRLKDRTVAEPEKNYVHPRDIEKYRMTAAYHAVGSQLRSILNGTITMPNFVVNSQILQTRLLERLNYLPIANFPEELQMFYEEILVSFLSDPQMSAVSWASDPSQYSGKFEGGVDREFPCVRWQVRNCFFYNYAQLWAVYAISMGITILAVASGVTAMEEDAMMRSLSFSAILAATRASSLDKLRWEKEADLKSSKIGFGVVADHTGERTYSFGVEGDVSQEKAMSTGRSPGISVMNWGDRAARRVSYAMVNKRDRQEN